VADSSPSAPTSRTLQSWKEIAAYLGVTVRTAQRWEEQSGLPVYRVLREKRDAIYANPEDLDRWVRSRTEKAAMPIDASPPPHPAPSKIRGWLTAGAGAAVLIAALWGLWEWDARPMVRRAERVTARAETQIQPHVSPDGKLLAYAWRAPSGGEQGIAVQPYPQGEPRIVTRTLGSEDLTPAGLRTENV
jgi:transcriptional regulator with XRE-family HTH domain